MIYSSILVQVATVRRTCCSGGLPAFAPVIPDVAKRRSGISRFSAAQLRSIVRAHARAGMTTSVMILEALGQFVDIFRRPARHFHAEMQPHLGQHFLDLVQRLAAEVRGAEHL